MIGVLTQLQARPERLAELLAALQDVLVHSLENPCCLAMHLHADPMDPCRMMIYEQWWSKTDFDVNGALPWFEWFWQHRLELLEDDIHIQFYDLLGPVETARRAEG